MAELGVVEDTLFVPMLGRIYASENFPGILRDEKALALKRQLPTSVTEKDTQTQYTYLASASRSANMDRVIKGFLTRRPGGAVVQLGVGLETTYWRDDDGNAPRYGVDLPHVIDYRRQLLPGAERETLIAGCAFEDEAQAGSRRTSRRAVARHRERPLLLL